MRMDFEIHAHMTPKGYYIEKVNDGLSVWVKIHKLLFVQRFFSIFTLNFHLIYKSH